MNILEIEGYAKKKSGEKGYKWAKANHAWNVVRLENGRDILFDSTWGAGQSSTPDSKSAVKSKAKTGKSPAKSIPKSKPLDVWTKEYRDYWFDTEPYFFALRHLPKEGQEKWSLVEKINLQQYENLPNPIEHLMFEGIVDAKIIYQDFINGKIYNLPHIN